jgi:DNA invertase Pin-like site-specific DNA recombinase
MNAPLPLAFFGRTSTLVVQDPVSSLRRQVRSVQEKAPEGSFIAAWFWDIESGGGDIEQRGRSTAHERFEVGIPRDGGLADLLAEASGPNPRFAAVMCEDIERSGRDTFNALKLERQLRDAGVPLFAADEPIDLEGMNATTLLVRRVKQGIAEWYRFQIKEKAWKGLREHAMDGWNIGPTPYGYAAERVPHPIPVKAAEGRTKTRLILDPQRAPVVVQIYAWRTEDRLGVPEIARRLNTSPGTCPPPRQDHGWAPSAVLSILSNPKYTGYMVFGRRRTQAGQRGRRVDPAHWLWSPEPTHPAIITRAVWDAAQGMGEAHGTSRDGDGPSAHPRTRRSYLLRGRVRCRPCQRRMYGTIRPSTRYYSGQPDVEHVYYICPHDPANPAHQAKAPDHPTSVTVREDALTVRAREFYAARIFGNERAQLLAAQLPANAAQQAAHRAAQDAALRQRRRQIDSAEDAHIREAAALADLDRDAPAVKAMRDRHIKRFTELEAEKDEIDRKLAALARQASDYGGAPALLDALPILGDVLPLMPERIKAKLFDAFDLQVIYTKTISQITLRATVTTTTPDTLRAIIATSETPDLQQLLDGWAAPSDLARQPGAASVP